MTLWLRWLALACFLTALFQAEPARAACSITNSADVSFGQVTSFAVRDQVQTASSTNGGVYCSDSLLRLSLGGSKINVKLTSQNNKKMLGPGGAEIGYDAYFSNGTAYPISFGSDYNFRDGPIVNVLGLFGSTGASLPIFIRENASGNLVAGDYTDKIKVEWDVRYCGTLGVSVPVLGERVDICLGWSEMKVSHDVTVILKVTNDCIFSPETIAFGSAPTVNTFGSATGTLSITCTKGISYTVGLGAGNNPQAGRRSMKGDKGGYLQYDLYKSTEEVWKTDNNRSDPVASTGNTAQTFSVIGKIYSDQATPAVDTYSDSVLVDVKY